MRVPRWLVILIAVLALCGQSAGNGGFSTCPYVPLTGNAAVQICSQACTFYGIYSPGVQANVLSCYDNPSAASGTLVYSKVVPVALNDIATIGVQMKNGLTCQQTLGIAGTEFVLAH